MVSEDGKVDEQFTSWVRSQVVPDFGQQEDIRDPAFYVKKGVGEVRGGRAHLAEVVL